MGERRYKFRLTVCALSASHTVSRQGGRGGQRIPILQAPGPPPLRIAPTAGPQLSSPARGARPPRTLSRVLAFPLRNDRARGGGGDGHPSLPGVLRGADQSAPQRPGPRWPLLPPRTPPLPRPGASTRRHEAREASRPPPQGPGRVPEQGLRMRVVCVARAGRRVHRQRRAGRRGDWRRGWPSWAAQSAPPRRVLAGARR